MSIQHADGLPDRMPPRTPRPLLSVADRAPDRPSSDEALSVRLGGLDEDLVRALNAMEDPDTDAVDQLKAAVEVRVISHCVHVLTGVVL